MSIIEDGFLSGAISIFIAKNRTENSALFYVAQKLNKLAQRLVAGAELKIKTEDSVEIEATALYLRALSNFQGAYLLAERGMEVEARTLARSCLETCFCLGAVIHDGPEVVDAMRESAQLHRKKFLHFICNRPSISDLLTDQSKVKLAKDQLKEGVQDQNLKNLDYFSLANRAGILDMYVWYRLLSEDSHVTSQALERYFISEPKEEKLEMSWGPEVAHEISFVISIISTFLVLAICFFNSLVKDADVNASAIELYSELVTASKAANL